MFFPRNTVETQPLDQEEDFEEVFSDYVGVKNTLTFSSGRSALFHVLNFLNVSQGDEVMVPVFTDSVVPSVVYHTGAKPVFVDVGKNFTIDPTLIEDKISEKTRAMIAVHLFGQPCNLKKISRICKKNDILLIEDCAHSAGGKFGKKLLGSIGHFGCFSFGFGKNLSSYGGGAVTTNIDEFGVYWSKIKEIRIGYNFIKTIKTKTLKLFTSKRISPIILFPTLLSGSTIGIKSLDQFFAKPTTSVNISCLGMDHHSRKTALSQLRDLEKNNEKRVTLAKVYDKLLDDSVIKPEITDDHVFHKYSVLVKNREILRKKLLRRRIDTGSDYSYVCSELFGADEHYISAKLFSEQIINLPMYPRLQESDIEYICGEFNKFVDVS
jgi:dTDP-4-amino-4,6-dideoxygalactose transaminase